MSIVSARYAPPSDDQPWIIAVDDLGAERWLLEDDPHQDWQDYLAGGGTITGSPPTQDEIDDHLLNRMLLQPGSPVRALAQSQFQLLNEVRALQGKPPLTQAQYKSHLKGLMRL